MRKTLQPLAIAATVLVATAAHTLAPPPAAAADDPLRAAVTLGQRVGAVQSANLGAGVAAATAAAAGAATPAIPPSAAVFALAARHGVTPSAEQRRAALDLDLMPQPGRDAVAGVLAAYTAFDDAARLPSSHDASAAVLGARSRLLDAVVALRDATASSAQTQGVTLDLCPAVAFDLTGTDDTYAANCALTVDVGGNDTYLNNAGGSNVLGIGPLCGGQTTGAGALVDLAGHDRYVSGRYCGINGGAVGGAGFLLDAAGDDLYQAVSGGINGGGNAGHGFLLDVAGNDGYYAASFGVNGGSGWGKTGALLDTGGNDTYSADSFGANGGAHQRGTGMLVDTGGRDSYSAASVGANGSADPDSAGLGLLLDGGGQGDVYSDNVGGTGTDRTVVPKGGVGAQLDLVPTFASAPAWVERTLLSQSVPATTPGVAAVTADLLRVKGGRSTTDPRNYDLNLWVAGQPSPTNPVTVFTGGLVAVPIDVSLLTTPAIPSQSAEVRLSVRHRYDATQVVCLLGVGGRCVNAPLNPFDIGWLATAGQDADLILQAELFVNGTRVAGETVPVPLVGQLLAGVS